MAVTKRRKMNTSDYNVLEQLPTVEEFCTLRKQVGWGDTDPSLAEISLTNTLYFVCIRRSSQLLATGRVIGDGAMYFYLQDIIVDTEFQGQGLGHAVMMKIETYLHQAAKKGATIGLFVAQGREALYGRYGYTPRPSETLGHGMCKFV